MQSKLQIMRWVSLPRQTPNPAGLTMRRWRWVCASQSVLRVAGIILLVFLLLNVANFAVAQIVVAPSVEWGSCSAQCIVVGQITQVVATPGPHDVIHEDRVVDVQEVIKGDVKSNRIDFTWREPDASQSMLPLLKAKAGVLLFLTKSKDNGSEHRMDDKWVPLTGSMRPWIVDLSKPLTGVYSKDMRIITDVPEMLKTIRVGAKSPVKQSLWLEVPFDSPVFQEVWSGSACHLLVPAEEKYRAGFMELAHSQNSWERARAAGELAKYPGKETEAVLRELLKDATESVSCYANDDIASVNCQVRAAAWHSLKSLGVDVPAMPPERKPTAEEQRARREKAWTESFKDALKAGWKITVTEGPWRMIQDREQVIVIVTCRHENVQARSTRVPKDGPPQEAKVESMAFLGTNGPHSQGGRRFYLRGELPAETTNAIIAYFGLEK